MVFVFKHILDRYVYVYTNVQYKVNMQLSLNSKILLCFQKLPGCKDKSIFQFAKPFVFKHANLLQLLMVLMEKTY